MSYITTGTVITGYTGSPVHLDISDGITSIGNYAFRNCRTLQTIIIPNSVTNIGYNAFINCSSLNPIIIPSSVTTIVDGAFSNCTSLTSIDIPSSITAIGSAVFSGCTSLSSVTIPVGVTAIYSGAFYGCTSLPAIVIPSSVVLIENQAFKDCSSLANVTYYNVNNTLVLGSEVFANASPSIQITVYKSADPYCFPKGVRIATSSGYRAIETLKTGDLVLTSDNRQVPIKAYRFTMATTPDTAPFKIPKSSLGPSMPAADLHLSPLHAFQLKEDLWQIPKYAATQYSAIQQYDIGKEITYYHFECPNFFTDNLVADGCIVESYGGKQLVGIKTIYTYNTKLGGFTRASASARSVRLSN